MEYELIREKRRTLSVTITGGEVIVKAPPDMTMETIENFLASKQRWIERKLAAYEAKTSALGRILDYSHVMIGGEVCDIIMSDRHKRISYEGGALYVPVKYAGDEQKAIGNWYRRTAQQYLMHMLEAISGRTGLKYGNFALTNARGKWGSCDVDCGIRLNWRLLMLEPALVDYVIIHELCHTLHHDHSQAFWADVNKFYPQAAAAKKRLKFFSVLTSIYR